MTCHNDNASELAASINNLATSINNLATSIKYLGTGDDCSQMGAFEFLGLKNAEAARRIVEAIREHSEMS
jgi:hypothetical protein